MSKLARVPVAIKEGVSVSIENDSIKVSGPKGNLCFRIPEGVTVRIEGNALHVAPKDKREDINALLGLTRATIANMVKGVSSGFEKKLELSGVGYRASLSGKDLILQIGFSHPVKIQAETGITYSVVENIITVFGVDKGQVGDAAARIRRIRPPDPYKEKGIQYVGERIRRKVGKAAKAVGAK